jgi:hypothetical protein
MSAHPSQPRAGTGLIVAGYILAILFWPIGLVLGIVALNKGGGGTAWGIIALSIVIGLLGILIVL